MWVVCPDQNLASRQVPKAPVLLSFQQLLVRDPGPGDAMAAPGRRQVPRDAGENHRKTIGKP